MKVEKAICSQPTGLYLAIIMTLPLFIQMVYTASNMDTNSPRSWFTTRSDVDDLQKWMV